MWWKSSKKEVDNRFAVLHETLKKSFSAVRQDTANLQRWLDYLNRKSQYQEQLITRQNQMVSEQAHIIKELTEEIENIPTSPEDIRAIIDAYYGIEPMKNRIMHVEKRLELMTQKLLERPQAVPTHVEHHIEHLKEKVTKLEDHKTSMRDRLVKRITKNSKEYVKGVIVSYIKKFGDVSALRLKEMIVDDQYLCSKSSFYRIIEEVEKDGRVGVVRKGREKHYFVKVSSVQ